MVTMHNFEIHEKEKAYMEQLRSVGHAVGQYVGGVKGDMEHDYENGNSERSEFCVEHKWEDAMDEDGSTIGDDAHPLTFSF